MGATVPKYLEKMINNIENGEVVSGKRSEYSNQPNKHSLTIEKQEDRFVKVKHFGTTILDLDFWGDTPIEKVTYCYMQSRTDAMIIHALLLHYNLAGELRAGYGSTTGATFTIRETGEDVYSKWR